MNEILNIPCEDGIVDIEEKSVNLVVTSPPYNLGDVSVHNFIYYNTYKDNKKFDDYIKWLRWIFYLLKKKVNRRWAHMYKYRRLYRIKKPLQSVG